MPACAHGTTASKYQFSVDKTIIGGTVASKIRSKLFKLWKFGRKNFGESSNFCQVLILDYTFDGFISMSNVLLELCFVFRV